MPSCECHASRGRSLVIPVGNPSNEDPPFGVSDTGPQDGKVGILVSAATGKPVSDDIYGVRELFPLPAE
ncbi:hypothetical protein [Amycolatopsis sp. lyj-108]|uniref:hypothetical protein n=1 Tax=Amycolatopsis sp. lyj-108 TaxID=2789286 RepID=UPI00397DDC5F